MSIAANQGYDALEVQTIQKTKGIETSPGTTHYYFTQDTEILDGMLDRNEEAELVKLYVNPWLASGGPDTQEMHFWYQTGFTPTPHIGPSSFDFTTDGEWTFEEADDGSTTPDETAAKNETLDSSVLFVNAPHMTEGEIGASGAGYSTGTHMAHHHENYREEYGGGPVVDGRDRIWDHVIVESEDNATGTMYIEQRWYWDIRG